MPGLGNGGCATAGRGSFGGGSAADGAGWTIRCLELQGDDALATVKRLADALRNTRGIRADDVFVRDDADGFARLYYGTYQRRRDPKTGERNMPREMRRDIDLIRDLGAGDSRRLFAGAIPVRMPMPDVGNPAWDLRHVDATYSLQVAVFEPTDDFYEFKQAAADYCALLRDRGYEAYYYHASASSSVTVGAFGPNAVVSRTETRGGRTYYVTDYAPEVQRLQREDLLQYNLLNGAIYRVRNETGVSEQVRSRLVEIPRPGESPTVPSADVRIGRARR